MQSSCNFLFLGSVGTADKVSLYPPHLITSSGSLTPAALIPFCSYQANMSIIGEMKNNLTFTACSQFKPTILKGQLCYSLNLTSTDSGKTETGKGAGLVILIDTGVENTDEMQSMDSNPNHLAFASSGVDAKTARVYINTLSSFTDYRAGSYAMSALKKMTGTKSFLNQNYKERKCMIVAKEECQAKSYIERLQKKCGCVPWPLRSALTIQVLKQISIIH